MIRRWLTPRRVASLVARYRRWLYRAPASAPTRDLAHADHASRPQEMQFAIDCLPLLTELLLQYPRARTVRMLDFGPGFGAGSNLFATLFRSDFLWCRLQVDALDIKPFRQSLARFDYPLVNYRVGSLDDLAVDECWDIVYCSNVIEHLADPAPLIEALRARARDWLILYAPFGESPLSPGHLRSITEELFAPFAPVRVEIKHSLAWRGAPPNDRQILVLLRGMAAGG